MKTKSSEQTKIDRELTKRKRWLIENEPVCIFCGTLCKNGELAHKIRRSYASSKYTRFELQTMKLNTGLGHHDCHDTFDNDLVEASKLPRFWFVMEDIRKIEEEYYTRMVNRLETLKQTA